MTSLLLCVRLFVWIHQRYGIACVCSCLFLFSISWARVRAVPVVRRRWSANLFFYSYINFRFSFESSKEPNCLRCVFIGQYNPAGRTSRPSSSVRLINQSTIQSTPAETGVRKMLLRLHIDFLMSLTLTLDCFIQLFSLQELLPLRA